MKEIIETDIDKLFKSKIFKVVRVNEEIIIALNSLKKELGITSPNTKIVELAIKEYMERLRNYKN